MKYIMCQPAIHRFKWELEVSITRLKKLGINDIVLLFSKRDDNIPSYLSTKYGVETHIYEDNRRDRSYIPSIKPYLWAKYLQEDRSRELDDYFYIDSDVIFRGIPIVEPNVNVWYGSDCQSYLGIDYLDSKGPDIFNRICHIVGVDPNYIRQQNPICGAQWVISKPSFEYWLKVYEDSNRLYRYLNSIGSTGIQKWTAEMWAQLYNVYYFDKVTQIHSELDFAWSTDNVDTYYGVKILHNAGVIDDRQKLFFKGKYTRTSPFNDDLTFVDPTKASIKYVEAIKEVVI